MAESAKVTSIEALELFRAKLIVYLDRASGILDDVTDSVRRTKLWLENDGRREWESELRKRSRKMEQAEQEYLSARNSSFKDSTQYEKMQLNKAKEAVEEAQQKLKMLKMWSRQFESRVEPLAKQMERLRTTVGYDMPKAVHFLGEAVKALAEYAELRPALEAGLPPAPIGEKEKETAETSKTAESEGGRPE